MRRPEDETGLRKGEGAPGEARPATRRTGEEKNGLNKTGTECVLCKMGRAASGECRTPLAIAAKPLKKLKTAMGSYWKKLAWIWVGHHVRLGLAPLPLGAGAAPAWDRRGL